MSVITKQIIDMIDMLPESEQKLAYEFIKRMVLAWDNNFTKLTPSERERLIKAENEIANQETVDHLDIDWEARGRSFLLPHLGFKNYVLV